MKLNLGCGKDIRKGYINLDISELRGVNVVHNLEKFPYPFKSNTFDEVVCEHTLHFLTNLIKAMEEIHRISKPGAKIKIIVPYYHSRAAHQDPLTKRFFTLDTFDYFIKNSKFNYYSKSTFIITKKKLHPTKLGRLVPKRLRNYVGMIFGDIVDTIYFELRVVK